MKDSEVISGISADHSPSVGPHTTSGTAAAALPELSPVAMEEIIASRMRLATSSIIAAQQIVCPIFVLSSPISCISFAAMPIAVDESAVPAATASSMENGGSNGRMRMQASTGSDVPLMAIANAFQPTARSVASSM